MERRHVLVHYHIFKNAGCSVDAGLQASFGDGWTEFEGSHAHDIQSGEQLARFLRANEKIVAVSSHLARPPLPWEGCLPVVFLRHPLLRARSVYEFTRRDSSQPYSGVVRGMAFDDYIRWALRGERGSVVIRNYQVIHLSRASWRCTNILDAQAGRADLKEACDSIRAWGVAGIVESFTTSVRVFNELYKPILPTLKLNDVQFNVTMRTRDTFETQIEHCRELLGNDLYNAFIEMNELDMDLYERARGMLRRTEQTLMAGGKAL